MRQDSPRPGTIRFADEFRTLDCTVQRSSASGALVKLTNVSSIARRFELYDGARQRTATVVWRRTGVLGVRFDSYFQGRLTLANSSLLRPRLVRLPIVQCRGH